jgi:dethiobiotin synthetase
VTARPGLVVVVAGTATEVGKTWVAASVLELARGRGLTVAARKPVQSFSPGDPTTDAIRLAAASGEPPSVVCPESRSYAAPMAPPMAAAALGRPRLALDLVVSELHGSWPAGGCDLALVEGAGGVASPLVDDGHTGDLARSLGADLVVLVADPALGVINSVRLSVPALAPVSVVVHLNRYEPADDLHRRNAAWLGERDGFLVTTTTTGLLDELIGP